MNELLTPIIAAVKDPALLTLIAVVVIFFFIVKMLVKTINRMTHHHNTQIVALVTEIKNNGVTSQRAIDLMKIIVFKENKEET